MAGDLFRVLVGGGRGLHEGFTVGPVAPGQTDLLEEVESVLLFALRDAVEHDRHKEEGQTSRSSKTEVEVVDRTEEQAAEASCAHECGNAEHRNGEQKRLVETGEDGRPSKGKLDVEEHACLRCTERS